MTEHNKIRVLPESLANKIAAGEVVERPSSIVKELVENSIDAGAQVVRVEIEAGGRKLIRVTDDGRGMSPDEVLLSIERHATSKIVYEEDLFSVRTLGFRGEALPSIAAVSRLEILTRPHDLDEGARLRVEGGTVLGYEPAGCAPGTVVTSRDIFFNVPARKKFLRTVNTEMANVSDTVSRIAMANPGVHFQLHHNGRSIIEAPPSRDLEARLADLLGRAALSSMITLGETTAGDVSIHGMVSLPELSRSNSSSIFIYVNGRPVKDRMIIRAATESYRGLLPKGRYPVMALFIDLEPSEVDVNVHPAKAEVKFRNSGMVFDHVRSAVSRAFDRKGAKPPSPAIKSEREFTEDESLPRDRDREERIMRAVSRAVDRPPEREIPKRFSRPEPRKPEEKSFLRPVTTPRPWGYFAELDVLGQLRSTYIICQSPEGLLLIDQHAAHERSAFERLRKEFSHKSIRKQSLLFPETIELGHGESETMERNLDTFADLGIDVEPFGKRTYRVTALPAVLSSSDPRDLVMDVLDTFDESSRGEPLRHRIEELFARMACHAVIRANRKLSDDEIRALLRSLDEADHPLTCPHGRPICVHITFNELEKMFGRK